MLVSRVGYGGGVGPGQLTARHHRFTRPRTWVELEAKNRVSTRSGRKTERAKMRARKTYNVYFRCSSISIIAAWLPHL
jgi:hypothetical protein